MATERLQKIIAKAGLASRRAAEQLILDGRVRVDGEVVWELGSKADPVAQTVEVDGHGVLRAEPLVYIALHKPEHVVSTVHDPEGRATVLQLLEQSRAMGARPYEGNMPRIYPVGRLDFDAEGLILLTNDGALSHAMLHPKRHVPKTYMVKVRGRPDDVALERLRSGVRLRNEDGTWTHHTAPAEVRVVKEGRTNTWLELTLFEGRNHQVKRMCDAIGHFTIRLIRTDFGGVELGDLPPAAWRFLTHPEIKQLKAWRHGGN
ncbi:MAG TPA: pseudouridine synthase [Myxococcota bacterium]|nr:pseudouridine synthase [Myxococcota bacterium]